MGSSIMVAIRRTLTIMIMTVIVAGSGLIMAGCSTSKPAIMTQAPPPSNPNDKPEPPIFKNKIPAPPGMAAPPAAKK